MPQRAFAYAFAYLRPHVSVYVPPLQPISATAVAHFTDTATHLHPRICVYMPPRYRTSATTAAHLCLPITTPTPSPLRTFAPAFAYMWRNLFPAGVNRNLSEPIKAYLNPSDFLRLVLIDSDKFRFLPTNIPPAPYHPTPPPRHTFTCTCTLPHPRTYPCTPVHQLMRASATTAAHLYLPQTTLAPIHNDPHTTPQRTITCP